MSFSLYKRFKRCEAETMAYLNGEIREQEKTNKALLVGNYLHTYFESQIAHENFVKEHETELISKRGSTKGNLKREYQQADEMIKALERQKLFNGVYKGQKEVILTGSLFGMKWKVRIDCLHVPQNEKDIPYFCDLKTSRDLHGRFFDTKTKTWHSFINAFSYDLQMAIYQEIIKQNYRMKFTPFIFGVSKQEIPEVRAIQLTSNELQNALEELKQDMPHIKRLIYQEEEPKNCGKCDYCKQHEQLKCFITADKLL